MINHQRPPRDHRPRLRHPSRQLVRPLTLPSSEALSKELALESRSVLEIAAQADLEEIYSTVAKLAMRPLVDRSEDEARQV